MYIKQEYITLYYCENIVEYFFQLFKIFIAICNIVIKNLYIL